MKKTIFYTVIIIILLVSLFISNVVVSDAKNYISIDTYNKLMSKREYTELLKYYETLGISKKDVENFTKDMQNQLQKELDNSSYFEKLNTHIYFKANINDEDMANLINSETEFYNKLSDKEKENYLKVFEEIINNE